MCCMDLCLYSLRLKKHPLSTKHTFSPIVPFVTLSTLWVFSHSSHLSCLSLVFFPVRVSPHNSPLSKIFFLLSSLLSFSALPSCAPYSPLPFPFSWMFLSYTLLPLSQGQRRGLSWLQLQPSLFTYWPAMEWSCRWTSQSRCLSLCRPTAAWKKMITSLLGDLTRGWVCTDRKTKMFSDFLKAEKCPLHMSVFVSST